MRGKALTSRLHPTVSQLYVQCSLAMRPDAKAASDTCRDMAVCAVQDAEGRYWYRCTTHRDLVTVFGGPDKDQTIRGRYFESVPR
jgi:hypothetical protein